MAANELTQRDRQPLGGIIVQDDSLVDLEENLLLHVGRRAGLPEAVLKEMDKTIELSSGNTGLKLCLALNYGSRDEIVDAVRLIAKQVQDGKLGPNDIDERLISSSLYTAALPDPDLLIRTAGEMRVSDFLLYQISYAELYVTPKYWPDFREKDLDEAIEAYSNRVRRFGGLNDG